MIIHHIKGGDIDTLFTVWAKPTVCEGQLVWNAPKWLDLLVSTVV